MWCACRRECVCVCVYVCRVFHCFAFNLFSMSFISSILFLLFCIHFYMPISICNFIHFYMQLYCWLMYIYIYIYIYYQLAWDRANMVSKPDFMRYGDCGYGNYLHILNFAISTKTTSCDTERAGSFLSAILAFKND